MTPRQSLVPIILAALGMATCAHSQSDVAKRTFEVASVKASPPPDGSGMISGMRGGPGTDDPTRVVMQNLEFFNLVTLAYEVKPFQVSGLERNNALRFTITAKVPAGATPEEFKLMLQNLLAERFQLKVHHEMRDLPTYELVVGKNGPKFKVSAGEPPKPTNPPSGPPKLDSDGYPIVPPGTMRPALVNGSPRVRLNAANESMASFVERLTRLTSRPVVDATGLKEKYDFILSFSPERFTVESPAGQRTEVSTDTTPDAGPSLATAIQEQLGLKLEPKKTPTDVVVVDHYQKVPTEN